MSGVAGGERNSVTRTAGPVRSAEHWAQEVRAVRVRHAGSWRKPGFAGRGRSSSGRRSYPRRVDSCANKLRWCQPGPGVRVAPVPRCDRCGGGVTRPCRLSGENWRERGKLGRRLWLAGGSDWRCLVQAPDLVALAAWPPPERSALRDPPLPDPLVDIVSTCLVYTTPLPPGNAPAGLSRPPPAARQPARRTRGEPHPARPPRHVADRLRAARDPALAAAMAGPDPGDGLRSSGLGAGAAETAPPLPACAGGQPRIGAQ